MFEDEKILLLETLDNADELIVIWIKLLCLAGRQNNGGVFLINGSIPYTAKTLARVFRRDVQAVREALDTFEEFGLIETVEDVITIPAWEKHQNIDGMEKIREQNRQRVERYRERQQQTLESNVTGNVTVTSPLRDTNAIRRKKEEGRIEEKEQEEKVPLQYTQIVALYTALLGDKLPKVLKLTDARKAAIKARWEEYGEGKEAEEAFTRLFKKTAASAFLTGQNDRKWTADFDWLMKPNNFTRVLEGKYDNRETEQKKEKGSFDTADFFKAAVNRRAT